MMIRKLKYYIQRFLYDGDLSSYAYIVLNLDSEYTLYSKTQVQTELERNSVSEETYVSQRNDCDDFAFRLMPAIRKALSGAKFGIIIGYNSRGRMHAWNLFVDNEKKVWFVEPQNDEIFEKTNERGLIILI